MGLPATVGCSDGNLGDEAPPSSLGGIAGELESRVVRFRDGRSETRYVLRLPDGSTRRLLFSQRPRVRPGTPLTVWGEDENGALRVDSFAVSASGGELGTSRSELVDGPAKKERKLALVLVDLGNGLGDMTTDKATAALLGNGDLADLNNTSLARYFHEVSYGEQVYTGDVLGPLKYTMSNCADNSMDDMANTLRAQIPTKYDQYAWYFARTAQCDWGGLGASGSPTRPAKDTWYNGALDCSTFVQEPGHNYGIYHSSSIDCGATPFADVPSSSCTHDEYGDKFDPMGDGCYHMNMWQKEYVGWIGGCNSVKVTSSGTFDIFPVGVACNGIQVLQIPMPKLRPFAYQSDRPNDPDSLAYYFVEYRYEHPFDEPGGALFQGVLIHVAPDYVPPTEDGLHTHILNLQGDPRGMHPQLPVGQSFADPAGSPTITVVSADATKATIKVEFQGGGSGAPTCLDGTTVTAPGPQDCGNPNLPGTGGDGGTGGSMGMGGAAGTGGAGGSGGAANTDGGSVMDGTGGGDAAGGSGGRAAETGGSSGAGGYAGAGLGGGAPDAGTNGGARNALANGPAEVRGSCSCDVVGRGSRERGPTTATWLAVGLLGMLGRRRRTVRAQFS